MEAEQIAHHNRHDAEVQRRRIDTPWRFVDRLTGSENHRGFNILKNSGHAFAIVQPMDAEGLEGRIYAEHLVLASNAHADMLAALKVAEGYAQREAAKQPTMPAGRERQRAAMRDLATIRAAIAKAGAA